MGISGGLPRVKMLFKRFLHRSHNSNPRRCGPIHHRAPARIFWRAVRGMLAHKSPNGKKALERLVCCDGVPSPYDKVKLMIVPSALKVLRKGNGRAAVRLGL